jgi:hypothetical protein
LGGSGTVGKRRSRRFEWYQTCVAWGRVAVVEWHQNIARSSNQINSCVLSIRQLGLSATKKCKHPIVCGTKMTASISSIQRYHCHPATATFQSTRQANDHCHPATFCFFFFFSNRHISANTATATLYLVSFEPLRSPLSNNTTATKPLPPVTPHVNQTSTATPPLPPFFSIFLSNLQTAVSRLILPLPRSI